jgi:type II secretory pathway component PulK
MKKRVSRKGSALVGVIWTLAVLSILIASYAVDAHLQTRINLYLRERVIVDHLTDAGLAVAEVILTEYQNVSDPGSSESVLEEQSEDDRWYQEKLTLKKQGEVSTGAIPVDALNPEGGTVSVTIRPIESKFNINNLYTGGDGNFGEIWMRILAVSGIPKDYWDGIVNGWCDWRDKDGTETGDEGAEDEFYSKAYEEFKRDSEYNEEEKSKHKNRNYKPKARNGEIVDIEELKAIRGFNEYEDNPINADAILNGGVLNPSEDEKAWITVTNGISSFFSIYGSGKINVNAVKDPLVLAVIPGIFQGNPDDEREEDVEEALAIAQKIIELRDTAPADGKNPLLTTSDDEHDTGNYTDFNDLLERVRKDGEEIQPEASPYLVFGPSQDNQFFEVTIIGKSFGIVHKIAAVAVVENKKVRYIRWQEDP